LSTGAPRPCGATPNSHAQFAQGNSAIVTIALDGSGLANVGLINALHDDGLEVKGSHDVIRGLSIYGFGQGNSDPQLAFDAPGSGGSATGDLIGIQPNGSAPSNATNGGEGILTDGSDGNSVGGDLAADPSLMNVIGGNGYNGVDILGSQDHTVQGNLIGTGPSGMAAAPNQAIGVILDNNGTLRSDDGNVIGGTKNSQGNLISGNALDGVVVQSGSGSVIEENSIGIASDGRTALGNGGVGVSVDGSNRVPSEHQDVTIGGQTQNGGQNIIAGNGTGGILVGGTSANFHTTIWGNFIGLLPGGMSQGNGGPGIELTGGAQGVRIGGGTVERNLISANSGDGILIDNGASHDIIQGNFIGTNVAGTAARPNGNDGVDITAGNGATTNGNVIGGSASGHGNVISGNTTQGVEISGDGSQPAFSTDTVIEGNNIGIGKTTGVGARTIPNGANGVYVHDGPQGDVIGGTARGAGNIIAGNSGAGVLIGSGTSDTETRAAIRGNSIYGNARLAIDLAPSGAVSCGVTVSTLPAPNGRVPCPGLASASTTAIKGTACRSCWVDLYATGSTGRAGAHGPARIYLGTVQADAHRNFSLTSPVVSAGQLVTATETQAGTASSHGDVTSELQANIRVKA